MMGEMAAARRKQDDKNLEILRELVSLQGNRYCFDCSQRGPTYVNITVGSFVCSKCSGMLRGLTPPHRVKSISLATFTSEEVELIRSRGNDYCRRIWLGLFDGENVLLKDEQSVKDFMSEKYEKKRYYLDPSRGNQSFAKVSLGPKSLANGNDKKSAAVTSPLISISPQSADANKIFSPPAFTSRPAVNNNNVYQPAPTTDFPVDFARADIYNGNLTPSNYFGSKAPQPANPAVSSFANFNANNSGANDRYAALADLDIALRQQKQIDNPTVYTENKNPFQTLASENNFNRNPFCNVLWGSDLANNGNPFSGNLGTNQLGGSKNPFL